MSSHNSVYYNQRQNIYEGFPDTSVGKESACNAGDLGSVPGSEGPAGEGIGYPLQYSWVSLMAQVLKNLPAVRGSPGFNPWVGKIPWRRERLPTPENSMEYIVHGVIKSPDTTGLLDA